MRRVLCTLLLACVPLATASTPVGAATATAPANGQTTQQFLTSALEKDSKTTAAIRSRLKSGAMFVDPASGFTDLTGDGKSDAIVIVSSGGVAGAIAVYVFSTDGEPKGKLRAVFRSQELYRARVLVQQGDLVIQTPNYTAGNELCCPQQLQQKTYTWDSVHLDFTRSGNTTVAGPGATAPAATQR